MCEMNNFFFYPSSFFVRCRTDGYIVCEEDEEVLRAAWVEEQEIQKQKEKEVWLFLDLIIILICFRQCFKHQVSHEVRQSLEKSGYALFHLLNV